MFAKRSFLNLLKLNTRYFSSSSVETYKISGEGRPNGTLKWVSGKTQNEFEIRSALESLLAALAGCENTTLSYYAKTVDMEVNSVSYKVEGDYDKTLFREDTGKPNRFSQIRMVVEIDCDSPQEDIDKLRATIDKHCPISNMLTMAGVDIKIEWRKKK